MTKSKIQWWHLLIAGAILLLVFNLNITAPFQAAFFDSLSTARMVCEDRGGGTIYECIGACPNDKDYCANFNSDEIQDPCDKYGDYTYFEDCGGGSFIKTCSDTDGGRDFMTKGTVSWELGLQTGSKTDYCEGDDLIEYYCTDDMYVWDEREGCSGGCENGVCKLDDPDPDPDGTCDPKYRYVYYDNDAEWNKDDDSAAHIVKLMWKAIAPDVPNTDFPVYHINDLSKCCNPVQYGFSTEQEKYCDTWVLGLCVEETTYQINGYAYGCTGGDNPGGFSFCSIFEPLRGALPDNMADSYCMIGVMIALMALLIIARMVGG